MELRQERMNKQNPFEAQGEKLLFSDFLALLSKSDPNMELQVWPDKAKMCFKNQVKCSTTA